jgi:hypothetical protein
MPKKKKIANTELDPTLPYSPVTIGGKEYRLCFDFASLAQARAEFRQQGVGAEYNLLIKMAHLDLDGVWVVFPCAVHKFHPELSFEDAQKLLNIQSALAVLSALYEAWGVSVPETKEAPDGNPPLP